MPAVNPPIRLLTLATALALLMSATTACQAVRLRKMAALEQAETLKGGVLLVRLQSAGKRVAALRERGYEAQARQAEERQQEENERIVMAFAREWDYSPVYFFFARHSVFVREGNWDGLLLDEALEPVSVDSLSGKPFLIAEFGALPSGSGNAGVEALILMNHTSTQPDDPFPSNVLTANLGGADKERNAVSLLNAKLQQFLAEGRLWRKKRELREAGRNL